MSESIWTPLDAENDPDHSPPVIEKNGSIKAMTDPPLRPETAQETMFGMKVNLYRNMILANHGQPDSVLAVDQDGQIPGKAFKQIVPENDKERAFIEKQDQIND